MSRRNSLHSEGAEEVAILSFDSLSIETLSSTQAVHITGNEIELDAAIKPSIVFAHGSV